MPPLDLVVNGLRRRVEVPPHWTLLDLLRDGLDLRGAKDGCGEGVCGACTVLVGNRPVRACLTLALKVQGGEVLTIEGLDRHGQLDPLQEAFVERGAVQCGFCSPGMILAAKALLLENPEPGAEEIREALAGNLCRCSGYVKIIEAVQAAAKLSRGSPSHRDKPGDGRALEAL